MVNVEWNIDIYRTTDVHKLLIFSDYSWFKYISELEGINNFSLLKQISSSSSLFKKKTGYSMEVMSWMKVWYRPFYSFL